jgi:hypothetical protein
MGFLSKQSTINLFYIYNDLFFGALTVGFLYLNFGSILIPFSNSALAFILYLIYILKFNISSDLKSLINEKIKI